MENKIQSKTIKKRVVDLILKLGEDELVLQQTALINIGTILKENKHRAVSENINKLLIEILMNIILYSSVDLRIQDLTNFVSDIPEISNLSDVIRFQSMITLLESNCYNEIDILRRLSSFLDFEGKDNIKYFIPPIVVRPLIEVLLRDQKNEEIIVEIINFCYYNKYYTNICVEVCFQFEDMSLLNSILKNLLPIITDDIKIEIYSNVNLKLLMINSNTIEEKTELNNNLTNLLLILLVNARFQYPLIAILITLISRLNIKKDKFLILLSICILSSIIETSENFRLFKNFTDQIQMFELLKYTLENGGILGFKKEKLNNTIETLFIILSIILYKTKNIKEFYIITDIICILMNQFKQINTLPFVSSLIYHIKAELIKNDSFCIKSNEILKDMFDINGINDLSNISIGQDILFSIKSEDLYDEINSFLVRDNYFDLNNDVIIDISSHIYNGLSIGLYYMGLQNELENQLFDIQIYDEIYYFAIINVILKWFILDKNISNYEKINNLFEKLCLTNYKYPLRLFDSLFPIYEVLLRTYEGNDENSILMSSIHTSMISFGIDKNTVPIIYNRILKTNNSMNYYNLNNIYHLFLKGELSFSKLEHLLLNKINFELSNNQTYNTNFNENNGYRILSCVIRYKPDIMDEIFIEKIQQGLDSHNKEIVSYSLHCLIELCKLGILDYDKSIGILLAMHMNILITDIKLPDNISPLNTAKNCYFGNSYKKYPIEILKSFLRFFNLYMKHKWSSDTSFYNNKLPNNIYYILCLIMRIIKDKICFISVYCLNIISKLLLEYFYQNVNLNLTLNDFILWSVNIGFNTEISNFFHFLDLIQQFICIDNQLNTNNIDFNTLQFIVSNLSGPIETILKFELEHEIYNQKKFFNRQSTQFNINIRNRVKEDHFTNGTILEYNNNLSIEECESIIKSKLNMINNKTRHNFSIQEVLSLFLYDIKQVRIELFKNIDNVDIEQLRIVFLKDIFKIIRNIKHLNSTTFQWQMIFRFIQLLKDYFNQFEFLINELIPKSKKNNKFSNKTFEQEVVLLFYLFLSYLPSISNVVEMKHDFETIIKCKEIRASERQLYDELFIENQALIILLLSALVILRYDLLCDIYQDYISNLNNIEILPNKLFMTFLNCDILIKKYFSKKNNFLDSFSDPRSSKVKTCDYYVEIFDRIYYLNRETSINDFIGALLRYSYQYSSNDNNNTLNNYYTLINTEYSIKVYSTVNNELIDQVFVLSSSFLANNYTFGLFSFFDIIFDSFSSKHELLENVIYLYNLSKNYDPTNMLNIAFQTVCLIKLFQNELLTIQDIFEFINLYFVKQDISVQEKNTQLGLIRAFCFSYIYYHFKKALNNNSQNSLNKERIDIIEDYSMVNMNIVRYYASILFYENNNNENQSFIISCIQLMKGYYWVPWMSYIYNKTIDNINLLNEICGIVYKNQLLTLQVENNKSIKSNDKYSNIDLLLLSCVNDPVKMSICILILSFQITNLTISLENKKSFHNKERFFDIKSLNKNSLFFATIYKLDIYTKKLIFEIKKLKDDKNLTNLNEDFGILQELIMVGTIIETFDSIQICDYFFNFNLSIILELILFEILIPIIEIFIKDETNYCQNRKIVEWFFILFTKFISSYLISNNGFTTKVIEFGYILMNALKESHINSLMILSFIRTIGIIIITCNSDLTSLYKFINYIFNVLIKMRNSEMYITALFVNIDTVFNSNINIKKPFVNIKINSLLIQTLAEISHKIMTLNNKTIVNSFKLLIYSIYKFFKNSNSNNIENFIYSINPLLFDKLILENEISINMVHDYYLRLDSKSFSNDTTFYQELFAITNIYYLYIKKNRSNESEILNFLHNDFIGSKNISKKQITVITLLLSSIIMEKSNFLLFNNFLQNKQYINYEFKRNYNKLDNFNTNNWTDIRNFYFLDLVDNPKMENWTKLFSDNNGIIFLSKNYYLLKQYPFSTIDTNLYYGKEFISWSLYRYPEIFIKESLQGAKQENWKKSISYLFTNSNKDDLYTDKIINSDILYNDKYFLFISYLLFFKLKNYSLTTLYVQFKDILLISINELKEICFNNN